nr:universal stress protein [Propionibacterium sp.]
MTEHIDYTGKIVVGTNGSKIARSAMDWAAARAVAQGRPLVLVLVVPDMPALSRGEIMSKVDRIDDLVAGYHRRAEERLEAEKAYLTEKYPGLPVEAIMLTDDASYPLARATHTAELVVIGSRTHSAPLSARALGGTSVAVASHAHGPVVIVPEDAHVQSTGPVVVGVDVSPEAEEAIRLAVAEAAERGVKLIAVHTWDPVPWITSVIGGWSVDDSTLGTRLEEMCKDLVATHASAHPELEVEIRVRPGHPAQVLLDHSDSASLIVLGSRGRGGFAGLLLGSTSREVIRNARCPVLITRGPRD